MVEGLQRLEFLLGDWDGEESGLAGVGTGQRTYRVLFDRYIEQRNRSTFDPQEASPTGEVHEDLGVFSRREADETIVLRAYHSEGFVITYRLEDGPPPDLVFVSTDIDNGPDGLAARLTLRPEDPGHFEEVFEIASPGGPFEEFLRNRWTRI